MTTTETAFEKTLLKRRHKKQLPTLKRTYLFAKAAIESRAKNEMYNEIRKLPLWKLVGMWLAYGFKGE